MAAMSPSRWFMVISSTVLRPSSRCRAGDAALEQHLAEAHVVARRADQAAAARRRLRRLQEAARLWIVD